MRGASAAAPWHFDPRGGRRKFGFVVARHRLAAPASLEYRRLVKSDAYAVAGRGLGVVILLSVILGNAEAKPIRLRNEVITPPANVQRSKALTSPTTTQAASGLFLIQFREAPQPEWRQQLETLGVQLLRYVPDDAFVADLQSVSPTQVRQLPYVTWLGEYRPEHKLHRSLPTAAGQAAARLSAQASVVEPLQLSILLSARAASNDVAGVRGLLQEIQQESKLVSGTVLRGQINPAQLNALAQSRAVLWIEPSPRMKLFDEVSSKIVAGDGGPNTLYAQSLGYDGSGVKVAVADSGLDSGDTNQMHPDIQGRVSALFYYGSPGQLADAADEHSHGTHCAGIIAGNGTVGETDENGFLYGLGVAPGASLIAQRIFDGAGGYAAPPSFETLTRDAKRAGADVGSNSWGDDTQGRYDISAMEFDELVRDADALALGDQGYILEFSAGNAGPSYQTVGSPAVAKNVIATGAANSDRRNLPIEEFTIYDQGPDSMADFSSRGPCEDGRIKPDVVAPGSWIASLRSVYANDDNAWWPISDNYLYQGGTSQAGPHVSGAAAVFVQFYRATHTGATPSPALAKAALINSATDMDDFVETGPVPNMDEGWGRVNLPALLDGARDYEFLDQSVLLTNQALYEKRVLIGSAAEPLRITLAYTDVPGNPAAVIALVNDLDLEVVAPDGHVYAGNQFADGESVPDLAVPDSINNVEAVHLYAPVPGEYLIRVHAARVVEDARDDTPSLVDQDFTLVVSAVFAAPGVGLVAFDRPVYRAPDQIRLTLVDYDLAGQASASILLRSAADPGGEPIALHANGGSGLFTGIVATATGPALADGKLQISHGNSIEAVYTDASPSSNRVFSASADLLPPVISNVQAANRFGQIVVSWDTDEDATAIVYYGTNTLNFSATNRVLDVTREFTLPNVPPNALVKFMAVAQDAAGNRSTNNNGGAYFTIISTQPPSTLLIDSYTDSFGLVAAPPLSGYTDALNALAVTYDMFDNTTGDEPTAAQLQAYRCVIWRMDEISAPAATLPQKLASYVNSGGSLFVASMEGLTRLTEAGVSGLNSSLLQVQSYTEDQPVGGIAGTGDPVGAGINIALDYSPYDELLTLLELLGTIDPSDWIVPTTNASPILTSDGAIVGIRSPKTGVDLPGRVVYLSFPLDAVPLGSGVGNNRIGLLNDALNFLAPRQGGSTLTLDSGVYSVPGRALAEVEDLDLQGQGQTSITVHSAQVLDPVNVTLTETTRRGLFRGSFVFVPTNTGTPGTLLVQSGDTIRADYLDASSGQTVSAAATIETNAPAISNVFIDPGYLEAFVTWDTSKDADALVQYSESPDSFPNNFTAYDPTLATVHEVFLSGLKPNRTYYVRVVSRDRAGNVTTDDNNGQLYTFTTLQPKLPPFVDDLETPSVEWSTYAAEESETDWTRGVPGGGESAHSPNNCWGSNLGGGPLSQSECYLISPGILLSGGNRATLRFWHNYDFTPRSDLEFELAAVEIITDITAAPEILWQLPNESSFGWEEVELDLTPYTGKVVYVAWHYFLFSFEAPARPGWLVDDVSITVNTVIPGTVQITNNVWQAVFALSGPTGTTARGLWSAISNAPPGQYSVQFGDAPYYLTPPPQTNTLTAGGTITFTGNYTFTDANTNGIPDAYETASFGAVNPLRTTTTDTDLDGMSDWAEFIAGTNPTNAGSVLELKAAFQTASNAFTISWPSGVSHGYRLLGSTNAATWSPVSDWIRASGFITDFTLSSPTNGAPVLFRLEAKP